MGLYTFNPKIQMGWVKTYPNKVGNGWVLGYVGHFVSFGVILVIFRFWGVFWSFYKFKGYFGLFIGFRGILIIFRFRYYFGHFLG